MLNKGRDNKLDWLLCIIILLGFVLRVHLLDQQSLWWDEAKTISRTLVSLPDLFSEILSKRHHLPLYFLLIRPWLAMAGYSEFAARYFSAVCGVMSLPVAYKVARLIGKREVGLVAAFLLAISPFHIWYSQEARMYTMVTLLILVSHYFVFRLLKNNSSQSWFAYFISTLLALYTHLFALLIMIVHYTYFTLYYRYLKPLTLRWFGVTFVLGLLFSVWGFVVLMTGSLSEATPPWIVSVHWYEPFLTLVAFSVGRTVNLDQISTYFVPAAFLIFLLIPLKLVKVDNSVPALDSKVTRSVFGVRFLYLWFVIPVFLTFIVSLDWPINPKISIYTDRYLIIVLPALIILVALGIVKLSELLKKTGAAPLIVIVVTLFTVPGLMNLYYAPLTWREDWRGVANKLEENALPNDVVWSRINHQRPLAYYLSKGNLQVNWFLIPLIEMSNPKFENEMEQLLIGSASGAKRVWFITQFNNNDLHGFPAARNEEVEQVELLDPQRVWLEDNFQLNGTWQFPGIQLDLFDLTNPK